jgi:hypothetical protein
MLQAISIASFNEQAAEMLQKAILLPDIFASLEKQP